jgi:hypothetical protein
MAQNKTRISYLLLEKLKDKKNKTKISYFLLEKLNNK